MVTERDKHDLLAMVEDGRNDHGARLADILFKSMGEVERLEARLERAETALRRLSKRIEALEEG